MPSLKLLRPIERHFLRLHFSFHFSMHCFLLYFMLFCWPLLSCLWGALHVICISDSYNLSSHLIEVAWTNFYSSPQPFHVLSNLLALQFSFNSDIIFILKLYSNLLSLDMCIASENHIFLALNKLFCKKIIRNWISVMKVLYIY